MNETEKSIETLQGECGCVELELANGNAGEKAQEFVEACHIAVKALREKAEREHGCEYCEWHNDPISRLVWECGLDHFDFDLNACPHCGRNIKEG